MVIEEKTVPYEKAPKKTIPKRSCKFLSKFQNSFILFLKFSDFFNLSIIVAQIINKN